MNELERCGCGEKAYIDTDHIYGSRRVVFLVRCNNTTTCGNRSTINWTEQKAIDAWNRQERNRIVCVVCGNECEYDSWLCKWGCVDCGAGYDDLEKKGV